MWYACQSSKYSMKHVLPWNPGGIFFYFFLFQVFSTSSKDH